MRSRRFNELDYDSLDPRVAELASVLERPMIEESWTAWKRELGERCGPQKYTAP